MPNFAMIPCLLCRLNRIYHCRCTYIIITKHITIQLFPQYITGTGPGKSPRELSCSLAIFFTALISCVQIAPVLHFRSCMESIDKSPSLNELSDEGLYSILIEAPRGRFKASLTVSSLSIDDCVKIRSLVEKSEISVVCV